jgi:DNA-3-methyladenine glycosylase II
MHNHEIRKAINHLSKNDKVISTIIKNIGIINLNPSSKYFNALLRSIIGQQLSVHAADTICGRFMNYFNNKPEPELIIQSDHDVLRGLGLSNAKVRYVKDLSEKILSKEISLKSLYRKTDEEILEELTKVKGIGVWTVHMFLIFSMNRPNVLPHSDLGIRKSLMVNYGLRKLPDEKKINLMAKKNGWHPYCSIVSMYLWRSLDNNFESILK